VIDQDLMKPAQYDIPADIFRRDPFKNEKGEDESKTKNIKQKKKQTKQEKQDEKDRDEINKSLQAAFVGFCDIPPLEVDPPTYIEAPRDYYGQHGNEIAEWMLHSPHGFPYKAGVLCIMDIDEEDRIEARTHASNQKSLTQFLLVK